MMRAVLFIGGWIATGLGAAGIFLPLLPATPFLLLAAACFARSSPRTRNWLLASPGLGPVLRDYLQHRTVPLRAKAVALLLLWPSTGWTAMKVAPQPAIGIGLVLLAAAVSLYLMLLPSQPAQDAK